MKKMIPSSLVASLLLICQFVLAQTDGLVYNQNPNYAISRDKYMKIADSINRWHGTTPQETYKAIDYLEDRRQAREDRRNFRRELRLARVRNNWWNWGGNDMYYNYGWNNGWNNNPWNNNWYNNNNRRWNRFNNWNNTGWSVLPWVLTFGAWCR